MTRGQNLLVAVLAVSVLAGGFFSCFERATVEMPTPISLEAARNPYLAASQLLEAMGHDVVTLDGLQSLSVLPPVDGTLILTTGRRLVTERRSEPLLDWVEDGGHLIVRMQEMVWEYEDSEDEREPNEPDPLLDPLDIRGYRFVPAEDEDAALDMGETLEQAIEDEGGGEIDGEVLEDLTDVVEFWVDGPAHWDTAVGTIGDGVDLILDFGPRAWELGDRQPLFQIEGDEGIHLLTFEHGAGFLTAVTDEWFLLNAYVDNYDHPQAIVHLARMGGRSGSVSILLHEDFPGIASQVLKYALPAAVSLLLLVGVWLWRTAPRFGPIAPDPPLARRQWIEHLEAVGDFHWRRDGAARLVQASRAGVLQLIDRRHPALARSPQAKRDAYIARISGLDRSLVRDALDEQNFPSAEANVARAISNLERIRSSL